MMKGSEAEPEIEVKVLRAPSGKVIFLESGPEFVELMFGIMNAPLSSLLPTHTSDGDLNPFVDLKESLCSLGGSSFVAGKDGGKFIPKESSMKELMKCAKKASATQASAESSIVPYRGAPVQPTNNPSILKENCKFMVTNSLQVFESSMVTGLELMKDHVGDFHSIKTSTESLTGQKLRNLLLYGMLGSETVLTDIFPDESMVESDTGSGGVDGQQNKRARTSQG
eukprot:Skav200521  [mRNA]  locus=scaffold450:590342:591016:- [translate_table: standard]